MRFSQAPRVLLALAVVLTAWGSGCAFGTRTQARDSAAERYGGGDREFDFWDVIAARPVVTNHDAFHGLLLVVSEDEAFRLTTYNERQAKAWRLGWISAHERLLPNESARVGMIAKAVCRVLRIKGGITLRLLGLTERYATRELVYRQMIPRRSENQSLSGLEFVDLMGKLEDALEKDK